MKLKCYWLLVLTFSLFLNPVHAAQLNVGDAMPAVTAQDQHGTNFLITTNVQFLLIAMEMGSAKIANRKLAEQSAGFLESHHAAYLMDIHTMPAVARFFAFPKLRKYPMRIVLVDSATALAAVPVKADCLTVLALTPAGRIQKIGYWNPANEPVGEIFK